MRLAFSIIFAAICVFVSYAQQPRTNIAGLELRLSVDLDKQFKGPPFWFYLSRSHRILVFSKDETSVFDAETAEKLPSLPPLNSDLLPAIISPNPDETRFVLYRYSSRRSELWDLTTMKMLKELPENDGAIRDVLWSNDGSRFMLAGGNWVTKKTHYIYDAENGSTKFIVNTKYKSTAEFSGSSPLMVTVERNLSYRKKDIVKVWNSETGELLHDLEFPYKTNSLWSLFSPSGEHIIVIDRMNRTDIFDTKTGKLFKTLDLGKDVFPTPSYVAFSPDGKKMLVGVWKFRGILKEKETWFRIYNTETFDLIGELKTEKPGKQQVELHQVVWRPDSRSVIAAGERYHSEYEAEAWNLDTFNQQYVLTTLIAKKTRALFEGGYDYFDRMEFTADSKYLVTTNRGKTKILRVWDADTGKLLISSDRIDGLFQLTSDERYLLNRNLKGDSISLYKISF